MSELTCIVCTKDCTLYISDDFTVSGNQCSEGIVYAMQEIKNPVRTVTSTVKISGTRSGRCPVKSLYPIPKTMMVEAINLLEMVELEAPIELGQVVIEDICSTGIPFVATRSIS